MDDSKFEDIQDAFVSTCKALALDYCDHTFIERKVREDMADEIILSTDGLPISEGRTAMVG